MGKIFGGAAAFLFGNMCAWYVFLSSGADMFSSASGWAAGVGVVLGVVFALPVIERK